MSIAFGLHTECATMTSNFLVFNNKYLKSIKEIVRGTQGRGKEEYKKIEGTSFSFPKTGILDYPFMYLDKIFVLYINFRKLFKIRKNQD
jgi:hypothetical protein